MILHNPHKYLTAELVSQCFKEKQHTTVDKQVCGNGFSTGFLNLDIPDNKINIMIAPNKSVIISKQKDYTDNPDNYKHRMKFFYEESDSSNFSGAEVLVFVTDSFSVRAEQIAEISDRVDKVLIDEVHSIHQQSLFRTNLVQFEERVQRYLPNAAIVSVTASPILYSKSDITINNALINPIKVLVSKDRKDTLERIKMDIRDNLEVVVFTQSALVINALKDSNKEIRARIEVGDGFKGTICKNVIVVKDYTSNLTIASSRGFEGFDIHYENPKVYFFEDRANEYESFYISNLYQALNRTRNGASYVELCRQELSKPRKNDFKDLREDLNEFLNDKTISNEKKLGGKYIKFKRFYNKDRSKDGKYILTPNEIAINLHYERLDYDLPFPCSKIEKFCSERNITFENIENMSHRLQPRGRREYKIENLYSNRDFLTNEGIYGDNHILMIEDKNRRELTTESQFRNVYFKSLDNFLIEKNYDGNYENTYRQTLAYELLEDGDKFHSLLTQLTKTFNKRSIEKYGKKGSKKWRDEFADKSANYLGQLACIFSNDKIYIPKNYVAHRDYNIMTKIGMDEIHLIANYFGIKVTEIDIVSCFPRVLYAINALPLPEDFYGEGKKNKVKLNALLNQLKYNEDSNLEKKYQKRNLINKLRGFNINEKVINYLIDNFFEGEHKSDFYNKMAFYECMLIDELIPSFEDGRNIGLIRRHDSLLLFDNEDSLDFLPEFTFSHFIGTKNWFKTPNKTF